MPLWRACLIRRQLERGFDDLYEFPLLVQEMNRFCLVMGELLQGLGAFRGSPLKRRLPVALGNLKFT